MTRLLHPEVQLWPLISVAWWPILAWCTQFKLGITVHRCLHNKAPVRFTWWTAVVESQTLSVDAFYDQLVNIIWLYHVTGWVDVVVGPSLLLSWQLGTLYRTASVTRRSAVTVLDACWRHSCLKCMQRVQGHSRSPILVPIESLYATSY